MGFRRRAHVYRIYQTDDDGKVVDPDVWMDILRIDAFRVRLYGYVDVDGQEIIYNIDWRDDTDTVPERTYEYLTIKYKDPDTGEVDDAVYVTIPLIHRTRFVFPSTQAGAAYQEIKFTFKNTPKVQTKRHVTRIHVINNDLAGKEFFKDPDVGDDQPSSDVHGRGLSKTYPVPWDDYAKAMTASKAETDKDQYVDAEVTDRFTMRFPDWSEAGLGEQDVWFTLRQDSQDPVGVETLFDPPDSTEAIARTDPFQTIVNVSWGGLAVEFKDGDI